MEIEAKIVEFLGRDLSVLGEDEDFVHAGLVDSFGYMQLLLYIEETFGINFSPEDLEDRRLRTLRGLREKILQKLEKV